MLPPPLRMASGVGSLILAMFPTDDDTPATGECLESVGVADVDIDAAWVRRCNEFEDGICGKWTRGDVRRLCAALGIELKPA